MQVNVQVLWVTGQLSTHSLLTDFQGCRHFLQRILRRSCYQAIMHVYFDRQSKFRIRLIIPQSRLLLKSGDGSPELTISSILHDFWHWAQTLAGIDCPEAMW